MQGQKLTTFVKAEPARTQKHQKARSLSQSDYKASDGSGMFVVRKLVAPVRADKMLTKRLSTLSDTESQRSALPRNSRHNQTCTDLATDTVQTACRQTIVF